MNRLPRIAVIGTGGTISAVAPSSLDILDYAETGRFLHVDELLARFAETAEVADLVPVRFKNIASTAMRPADWLELHAEIHAVAAREPGLSGIVVTHGTSTLEETAYFLNLTCRLTLPVVLVGAQRPSSALSTDAGMNLVNALRVAGCSMARGQGVLVLLNDEIHAAREVAKTSTYRLQTFRTPDFGVLGHVDGDGVHFYRSPVRRHAPDTEFDLAEIGALPRVDILATYAGSDGVAVAAYRAAGARGIIAVGLPPGIGTPADREALEEAAAAGIVIVQSTRAHSGRIAPRPSMIGKRIIAADNLSPQKARVLLMLALARTSDLDEIRRMFAEY